jgi:putative heme-binding domain-containing protein
MFAATACFSCHRFNNEGGATGPDLTTAGGRYSAHDFLDQIINPSKVINEQFVPVQATLLDGTTVHGVIVNLSKDIVQINTDLTNPSQRTAIDRKLVKSIDPSPVSPMPPMLLGMLEKDEILDLVAYVLSGGNPEDERFE